MNTRVLATCPVVLAGVLCAASPMVANAGPAADPDELLAQGEDRLDGGDTAGAAAKFDAAYRAMDPAERVSDLGQQVALYAATTYGQAFESTGDAALLQASRQLLTAHIADLDAARVTGAPLQTAKQQLQAIEAELSPKSDPDPDEPDPDEPAETDEPPQTDEPQTVGPTAPVTPQPPTPVDDGPHDRPSRDKVGIGLLVGGAVAVAAGIGLLIAGGVTDAVARNRAGDRLDNRDTDPAIDQWWDDVQRNRNALLGAGAALTAVGVIPLSWGAVRLTKQRRQTARRGGPKAQPAPPAASLRPWLGPNRAGAAVTVRW